ncbi:MAG TPA: VTT domain-containing protein [Gammaproteobacteria bacterium]|nr:VTT domain-containing protein [Gammaproteobacteria bacterium]
MDLQSHGARRVAGVIFVAAMLASAWFGMRAYRAYLFLRSAQMAGAPATSSIRPWMTLGYVSASFHVPESDLLRGLALPPATNPNTTLRSLAERQGDSPLAYVRGVQRAIARATPRVSTGTGTNGSEQLGAFGDQALSAVLTYGYYALGLTVLLGSIGLPVADGLATAVAGSLAAQGRMEWGAAALVVLLAAVLGDAIAYLLGRLLGQGLLERSGRWVGYTPGRGTQVMYLFKRWGGWTVLITRTFVSYLSSVASVLAGVSRYALPPYFAFTVAGRLLWTSAYLGLGYAVGADLQAATDFLANLSGMLIALAVVTASAWIVFGPAPWRSTLKS